MTTLSAEVHEEFIVQRKAPTGSSAPAQWFDWRTFDREDRAVDERDRLSRAVVGTTFRAVRVLVTTIITEI